MLSAVANLYYKQRDVTSSSNEVQVSAEYDQLELTTLDLLLSPLRQPHPLGL